jgi:hypothetical protein
VDVGPAMHCLDTDEPLPSGPGWISDAVAVGIVAVAEGTAVDPWAAGRAGEGMGLRCLQGNQRQVRACLTSVLLLPLPPAKVNEWRAGWAALLD